MAGMFIRHRVSDCDRWKASFDEHQSAREAATMTSHSLHRDADDPNVVIVAVRLRDLAKGKEFAASDDLRVAMQSAGVEGEPVMWFAEDVEDKSY